MTAEGFLRELKTHRIAVFGTGYVARVLWRALREHGLTDRVRVFVVSEGCAGGTCFGRPVLTAEEFRKDAGGCRLVLAVHEAIREEAERALAAQGLSGIWAAPFLPELLYGRPLRDAEVPVSDILKAQDRDRYWLAVRYGAVRSLLEGDETGAQVYRKALSLFCFPDTAEKRLQFLRKLIDSVQADGFDPERPILLDDRYRLIDGLHRLALARYLGHETVVCRFFRSSPLYDEVMDERTFLQKDLLETAGLTEAERQELEEAQRRMLRTEVSCIVPVYNVDAFLDTCVESLLRQTFPDLEVLLIDDGSTDGSGERCDRWARKDSRVRVIHKENGGVSSARNTGIELARGTWLAFVDPDDWVEPDYLEKLIRAAEEGGADRAECDIWRYDGRTGRKIRRSCGGTMGIPWTKEERMKLGSTATYKAVSRRALWMENGIRMPDCSFESPAVYALVLALSKRIVHVPEPLYYYRRFRPGSLIETGYAGKDGRANNALGIEAMAHLLDEFRARGLYERYAEVLEGAVTYRLSDILATQFYRKTPEDYRETVRNFRAFLAERYPASPQYTYITFGGYNLGRILTHMKLLHDPYARFNFSSLISVTAAGGGALPVRHRNRYREIMLRREEDRAFWDILRELRPAYLFMDLIEERFDILERDGRYITASDARSGAAGPSEKAAGQAAPRMIARDSRACAALFREMSLAFAARVRETVPGIRPVIVEMYLCGTVGLPDAQRPYDDAAQIRARNAVLREEYAMLRQAFPEAVRIVPEEMPELEGLLFTDEGYEYGAVPSHLNEIANRRIAARIEEELFGDRKKQAGQQTEGQIRKDAQTDEGQE